ncbi:DUF2505 domain-containing protein [Mycobacterium sp.]|uniref:DUF2505 domain-containing protein n=1 Tax=Mycobacterium sp. TaxID=1785 RepID=UPI002B990406|nr:DUF2505 domain-containing protein [Mycobacterium sp.]HKP43413.1 DUF2505 domain-containing protein [Mycobacterium sp.]
MSRSFDVSFESPASVEQVHSAFGDEDYWLARIATFGGSKRLDSLVVDSDGTVTVTITEDLRRSALPGTLATLYRGDLNVRSTESWRPVDERQVNGEISVAVTGAPGSGHGTAVLAPVGEGSRLTFTATVEFKVPLLGGTIERFVAREFAQGIPQIQRFTTTWISEHA